MLNKKDGSIGSEIMLMEMIHDEISDQIIESAKKIARAKKAGKITVRDILNDLKITNRVFYNRFHNIDEVMQIIYSETIARVRESLLIPWDGKEDYGEHIKTLAARTLILSYESRQYVSQYIFEADSSTNANFEWWDTEIKKLLETGKRIGFFSKELDVSLISYSIWCFIRGFNADAMARKLPKDEALKQFLYGIECLFKGMK